MAIMEVLHFGSHPDNPGGSAGILAKSGGVTQEAAEEIARLCQGWSKGPVVGDVRPILLSFPLKNALKSTPRGAHAVVRVSVDPKPRFQVVVLDRNDYRDYGYNPFAIQAAGLFPEWDPGAVPGKVSTKPPEHPYVVTPPPSPEDVGLVDEALHQLLVSQKLYFPIGLPCEKSDRTLSLLIEVLPDAMKQQLRFASFTPSTANGYHLAATETPECDFTGWQRLMMTLVGGELPEKFDSYLKKVRECLAYGDLNSLRQDRRQLTLDKGPVAPAGPVGPAPTPKKATTHRIQAAPPVNRAVPSPRASRPGPAASVASRDRQSHEGPRLASWRGSRRQMPAGVVVFLVVLLSLGGGWAYLQFAHHGDGISWSALLNPGGGNDASGRSAVPSLLEVVDVAGAYEGQMRKLKRAQMIPGLSIDLDGQAMALQVKQEAGTPLLAQIDLFLDLAGSGIRQGARPDRELERMRALARQGEVLDVELGRLILAWHGLNSEEPWRDLGDLGDKATLARRDSLRSADKEAYKAACGNLEVGERPAELAYAVRQTRGMTQLLALFQAEKYSDAWATRLYRAAEAVSPQASPMTRAYRNSAFNLVRLKGAEHGRGFAEGAFRPDWIDNGALSPAVRDILPNLRRAVGHFAHDEAPEILAGILSLYSILEDPRAEVAALAAGKSTMQALQKNRAVLFDPGVYADHLSRIRHEAVAHRLAAGKSAEGLADAALAQAVAAFEATRADGLDPVTWQNLAATQDDPFLATWSGHLVRQAQDGRLLELGAFEDQWLMVARLTEKLRSQASAGNEWSQTWRDLHATVGSTLTRAGDLPGPAGTREARIEALQDLEAGLERAAPLVLDRVTVRLDQDRLADPVRARVHWQSRHGGKPLVSPVFAIGPAAPAGSGWVGTVIVTEPVTLGARQGFRMVVRDADSGAPLLEVDYPALAEGGGPSALARRQDGEGGSIQARIDPGWWRALDLSVPPSGPGI